MSILLYGQQADRTHENQMLRAFIRALQADWVNKDIVLIANSMWNGAELDLVCILPTAIIVVDFKHYSGHLEGTENGPWQVDGVAVKGGSKANPFQQLRDNKFAVINWLKKHQLLQEQNIGHVNAAVVFTGPISGAAAISVKASYWFHTTDLERCAATLADITSPELKVYPRDIQAILDRLGVQGIAHDYGQANYLLESLSAQPNSFEPEEGSALDDELESDKTIDDAINQDVNQAELIHMPRKRMSGLFKSTLVLGCLFVTMAIISQIYPSKGHSATAQQEQILEAQSSAATTHAPQLAPPAFKHNATTYLEQINAAAAVDYIDQEVLACGTVAQISSFKKGVYINLDKAYPQQALTLVVWEDSVAAVEEKLGRLNNLVGVDICAQGTVSQYKGSPRIELTDAAAVDRQTNKAQFNAGNTQSTVVGVERIEAYRAPFYVGQQVMACGALAATSKFSKGLYLSLDKPYPNQTLTLIVWDESIAPLEAKFGSFNSKIGRTFCALGTIEKYKKNLQIKIENPQFLRLMLH